jgi:hypothetical protein
VLLKRVGGGEKEIEEFEEIKKLKRIRIDFFLEIIV